MARSVGSIEVTVDADTSQLKAKLTAAATIAGEEAKRKIDEKLGDIGKQKLDQALARVRSKIDRALSGIAVDIGIEDSRLRADLKRLQAELRAQELDLRLSPEINDRKMADVLAELRAAISEVDVPIGAEVDSVQLRAALEEIHARLALVRGNVAVSIAENLGPEIESIKARLKAAFAGHAAEAEIGVSLDEPTLEKAKADLAKAGNEGGKSYGGGFLSGLSLREQAIAGAIAFLSEPIALLAQSLASVAAQVAGSAFQALGAAAGAATPLVFGLGGALSAVIVGSQGMTTAFKAVRTEWKTAQKEGRAFNAQAEEITNALKELSPSAAATATAFVGLQDTLGGIQRDTQEALFSGMADVLAGATPLIKNMGDALVVAAGQANTFAKDVITALEGIDFKSLVTNLTPAMDSLSQAVASVVSTIQPFIEAATPAAERLAGMLKNAADSLLAMVQAGQQTGGINQFLQDGLTALSTWWDLLKNVGKLLFTIFQAGADSGSGLVRALSDIVGKWNEWLNTPDGQAALLHFFEVGKQILADLKPILDGVVGAFKNLTSPAAVDSFGVLTQAIGDALPVVAELLAIISRAGISTALEEAISAIAKAITPVLPTIEKLATAIGTELLQAVDALKPLLPPLASLIGDLAKALTPVVKAIGDGLAIVLPPIVKMLGDLMEAVRPLLPVMGDTLAKAIDLLAKALAALLPSLQPLVDAFGKELATVLPDVAKAFDEMFTAIKPLIPELVKLLDSVVKVLVPLLPILVRSFLGWVEVTALLFPVVAPLLEILLKLINLVLKPLTPLLEGVSKALTFVETGFQKLAAALLKALPGAFQAVVDWFSHLPQTIVDAIANGYSLLQGLGSSLVQNIWTGLQSAWTTVSDFFVNLPSTILGYLQTAASTFLDIGSQMLDWLVTGLTQGLPKLAEWWLLLPFYAAGLVVGGAVRLVELGGEFITWLIQGIVSLAPTLWEWFTGLPDMAASFTIAAYHALEDLGNQMIRWVADGVTAAASAVWDFFSSLPSTAAGYASAGIGALLSLGTSFIETILSGVNSAVHGITTFFANLPSDIVGWISGSISALFNAGVELVNQIVSGIGSVGGRILDRIKDFIPSPGDVISGIGHAFTSGFGVFGAEGGIFTSATPAIIGEAGREALIPLDRPLSLVDPSVRSMAALLRGVPTTNATGNPGNAVGKQVNVYQNITPTSADPAAVAQQIVNRAAAMAS
jgi:phage-related protein